MIIGVLERALESFPEVLELFREEDEQEKVKEIGGGRWNPQEKYWVFEYSEEVCIAIKDKRKI
ncbi:MAG: hypothetical protein ACOYVK_04420 [Bacillota bacterium]